MSNIYLIEKVKQYAKEKHKGQVDKAEDDYFTAHVEVVANKVKDAGYSTEYIVTAYLHDIVEDTDVTIEDISEMFGDGIAEAIDALTKVKNEDYEAYIDRVKTNHIATVVKYYDMEHNSDLSRLKKIRVKDLKRQEKYQTHMEALYPLIKKNKINMELKDITAFYHTKMFVLAQYSKLIWTRFNWFLAIEAGLMGAYFTKNNLLRDLHTNNTIIIIAIVIAFIWFLMGINDQVSIHKHKQKGKKIENIIMHNYFYDKKIKKQKKFFRDILNISQSGILWFVPLLFMIIWLCILICIRSI